jgi:hypothetical protein
VVEKGGCGGVAVAVVDDVYFGEEPASQAQNMQNALVRQNALRYLYCHCHYHYRLRQTDKETEPVDDHSDHHPFVSDFEKAQGYIQDQKKFRSIHWYAIVYWRSISSHVNALQCELVASLRH